MTARPARPLGRLPAAEDRWARLSRITGLIGLAAFVLVFTPIIAVSTLGEPPFTATTEQAYAFLSRPAVAGRSWRATVVVLAAIDPGLVRGRTEPAARPRRGQPAVAVGRRR